MATFNEISCQSLLRLIGTPECPQIIDVCIDEDFALDPRIIPSSMRVSHKDPDLISRLQGRGHIIVACQKGKKLSHGVAARLRAHGISAEAVSGGVMEWARNDFPMMPLPALGVKTPHSTWVTRHRPKVDRVACSWLIKRFIDPHAEILFVPPSEVLLVAEKFGAHPFDVNDCQWTHRSGDQGDECTFDALVHDFKLDFPALHTMANIIRAADTGRAGDEPQAEGLLAISLGLSRAYKDDLEQITHGMTVYDALYRWARDAGGETHASMQDDRG